MFSLQPPGASSDVSGDSAGKLGINATPTLDAQTLFAFGVSSGSNGPFLVNRTLL